MSTLGPSRQGSKRHARDGIHAKMVPNLDLNFPPVECQQCDGTSGSRHPQISRGTSFSAVPYPSPASEQQQGSSAPSSDRSHSDFIDLELMEDEVVTLSSSRGLPLGRNHFRRNQPVTMILEEDLETDLRQPVIIVEEQVANSPMNTRNKRARSSTSRTAIDCDHYPDLEEEHNAKRKNVIKSKPEPVKVLTREPIFTCPVCMDALVEPASTICGHIFCLKCIKASVQAQKKCPTCRRQLTMKSFHRVYLPSSK
ncbi:unnamed protein product [Musa hybrid cultivar]